MKKSRFTEERVADALRQAEAKPVPRWGCVPAAGIAEAAFYASKKKYGQFGATEQRKMHMLEEENA